MPHEEPHAVSQPARQEEAAPDEAALGEAVLEETALGEAAQEEAALEETARETAAREAAVRLRVGQRLRELAQRLDQPSFALLLKVVGGVNAAFAHRNEEVAIDLTDEERALYTPALQRELVTLLELACFPRQRVRMDDHPVSPPDVP